MKNDEKQTPRPFDISVEELEPMLDIAIDRKAEADAAEADRLQRERDRDNKRREDAQRAGEARAAYLRGREIYEWAMAESE
jgi:hypothetical protein